MDDAQCSAVWPDAFCDTTNICQCLCNTPPSGVCLVAAQTRDGTVCVDRASPACPLPEGAGQSSVLSNRFDHPLTPVANRPAIQPIFCTSTSTATAISNGGSGETWCIYPADPTGQGTAGATVDTYIADIYDCVPSPFIAANTNAFAPPYASSVDGVCCPSKGMYMIETLNNVSPLQHSPALNRKNPVSIRRNLDGGTIRLRALVNSFFGIQTSSAPPMCRPTISEPLNIASLTAAIVSSIFQCT